VSQSQAPYGLTEIEIDVIRALCEGRSRLGAGLVVCRSSHTVSDHIKSIYRKMGVHHRASMALKAERAGLLAGVEV
jgi:DNA-binding NarL/FixJ family response regulator